MERHGVGRRVVEARDEHRILRQHDSLLRQSGAGLRIVQQLREKPCRNLARVAAAGAAVIGALMRVVGDLRAMAEQQHQRRMAGGEAHGIQHRGCRCSLRFGGHAALDAGCGLLRRCVRVQCQRILHELDRIGGARRLDEGEGGDGGLPEPAPGPDGCAP